MEDFIIIAILIVIVSLSAFYVYKAKKSGQKCIGCPYAQQCHNKCEHSSNATCNGNCTSNQMK